jgi:hypothetical protein
VLKEMTTTVKMKVVLKRIKSYPMRALSWILKEINRSNRKVEKIKIMEEQTNKYLSHLQIESKNLLKMTQRICNIKKMTK